MDNFVTLLISGSYEANALAIVNAITAIALLMIGAIVYSRSEQRVASSLFLATTIAIGGWLLAFAFMYASVEAETALIWARRARLMISLVPACAFHFVLAYTSQRRAFRFGIRAVWTFCVIAGIIGAVSTQIIPAVRSYPWGFYPLGTALGLSPVPVFAVIFGSSTFLLWRTWRTSVGEPRRRAGLLTLAFCIGGLAFLDYLPALGVPIVPLGIVGVVGFAILTAIVLSRDELVDLTPEFAASHILETMKGAVLLVDMTGRVRLVNRATCTMLGYEQEQLTGAHIKTIIEPDENLSTGQLLNSLTVLEQSMRWRSASGETVDVLASSSFIRDKRGTPVGVVYVANDYTERKKAEVALRESEQRYRMLFDANPIPMWVYDTETLRVIAANEASTRNYGYALDEFLQLKITDLRPPEDVPALLELLPQLKGRRGPAQFKHVRKDGALIDAEVSSFEFMSGGRRSRLAIAQDVTERRRAEQRLRDSEERYRTLFERNLAGVYRSTSDGRLLECNEACARIYGYESPAEMMANPSYAFYPNPEDRERAVKMLREQGSLTNIELQMQRKDGSIVWVLENATMIRGTGGAPDVMEGTIVDITDRKLAQERVEHQAYHDSLTGLPNRRLFRDRLSVALAQAKRKHRLLAVMFLDLDQFKLVNDTLGHTVGDRLLQAAASRIATCVRTADTVARMGGDEFTVLLPEVSEREGAELVARKILDALRHTMVIDGHELHVTTSIGIAMFPDDGEDAETLLRFADTAMYRAKEGGRDRFAFLAG